MENQISLIIDRSLVQFVETALTRLRYLYPDITWEFDHDAPQVVAAGDVNQRKAALQKDLNYQIYREKILLETAVIRRRLYEAL
ncbi:MAG: hypothetical protein J0653_06040 [Deltaproteobacteria bacterium]|nr:hypothetical protein [Deltaproteobacteria bacterium]